jgi:hypothetical protein
MSTTSSLLNMTMCSFRSMALQVGEHRGDGHLCVSGLEAALHCGLDAALCVGVAHALLDEAGVATEVGKPGGKPGPLHPGSLKVGDVRAWILPLGRGALLTLRAQMDEANHALLGREADGGTALRGA